MADIFAATQPEYVQSCFPVHLKPFAAMDQDMNVVYFLLNRFTVSTSRKRGRQTFRSLSASGIDIACELKLDGRAVDEYIPV
jgi:hypothetical protein